jgi:hypothetical protein
MPRQTLYNPSKLQIEPWPPTRAHHGMSNQPAREIYLAACQQIATMLIPYGFKYTKSKQRCQRVCVNHCDEIRFQSSHFNVTGYSVQLWMHATVASPRLESCRAERLPAEYVSDHLAGGMVHLLGEKYGFVQWEIADPTDREVTVLDACEFILREVIPYFELFDNPDALIASLAEKRLPGLDLCASVEFAYCFGSKDSAQAALDRFVHDRPDLREAIRTAMSRASESGLVNQNNFAEQIAFLCRYYGLDCSI